MPYEDDWARETNMRMQRWADMRWRREFHERDMHPDERLDEVGWDIYYCASQVMESWDAADLALDGNLRQRRRVRDDLFRRHLAEIERRYAELHPGAPPFGAFESDAAEQLKFWNRKLRDPAFVYFIQAGDDGPIKIGFSNKPTRRIGQLQTGNDRELHLRHVVPGDLDTEAGLHHRFRDALIRGEWFGREYLPVIVAFAGSLADEMLNSYDGSGHPPRLLGGEIRTDADVRRIRSDIERMWLAGHDIEAIIRFTGLDEGEVREHFEQMKALDIYDVRGPGGYAIHGGRLIAARARR